MSDFSKMSVDDLTREERYEFLIAIGCIVCRNEFGVRSDPCIHHIRSGQGKMRAPDHLTIPLCPPHHHGYGHGLSFHDGPAEWQERYGEEVDLLTQVNELIGASIAEAQEKKAS